jgi:peptidoglycan hydrolase-like protein with peptidoglycan-binding domain
MPDLKYGDGLLPKAPLPDVVLVQQKLGIKSDGRFGNETRDAVIAFQVKTGLAPNQPLAQLRARGFGAVKQATWVKLFAVQV